MALPPIKLLTFIALEPLGALLPRHCRDIMVTQAQINVTQKIPDADSDFVDLKLVILVISLLAAGGGGQMVQTSSTTT